MRKKKKKTRKTYSIHQWWPVIVPFVNRQDEWSSGSFLCPRPCRNKWDVLQSSNVHQPHRILFQEALKGTGRCLVRRLCALRHCFCLNPEVASMPPYITCWSRFNFINLKHKLYEFLVHTCSFWGSTQMNSIASVRDTHFRWTRIDGNIVAPDSICICTQYQWWKGQFARRPLKGKKAHCVGTTDY